MENNTIISNILLAIFIIFVFMACLLPIFISYYLKTVKNNWSEYRCNPLFIPFAGFFGENTTQNFIECVGGMQNSAMPKFTAPLVDDQTSLTTNMDFQSKSLSGHGKFIGKFRKTMGKNFSINLSKIGGVTNEFSSLTTKLTSLMTDVVKNMQVLTNAIEGSVITGKSAMDSDLVKSLKETKNIKNNIN